jgi:hypothetical protein
MIILLVFVVPIFIFFIFKNILKGCKITNRPNTHDKQTTAQTINKNI